MTFRITGLSAAPFLPLFGLPDNQLEKLGIKRYHVDECPGFPDRIEMRDATVGETVLLLNHLCQPAETPYRASHAIFVREGAVEQYDTIGEIPQVMRLRLLSLRAYSSEGMMLDADIMEGGQVETLIERLFADPNVDYIHAHNAKRGSYRSGIKAHLPPFTNGPRRALPLLPAGEKVAQSAG